MFDRRPRRCKPVTGRRRSPRSQQLVFESLEARVVLDGSALISEFMAINRTGLEDFEGECADWLEIYNPSTEAVDLTDWRLRDSGNEWIFPAMSLGPGEFRLIFASGKNLRDPAAELHTNFALSGSGEYLGLLDETGTVVHQYDEYPEQKPDVSFGIAQDIQTTYFVAGGDIAKYLVPDHDAGEWATVGHDDGEWDTGRTAVGFADTVPGFAVWNYKANTTVGSLDVALQVIDNPNLQSAVHLENAGLIDYYGSGGGHGHYTADESPYPGMTGDMDDFVTKATAVVMIPTSGDWTFGVNSDDGFRLDVGSHRIEYPGTRGPGDTLGTFTLTAGQYDVTLVVYERGGGAEMEFFAAQGSYAAFDPAAFRLVGDVANGGLEVFAEPVTGGSGGSVFAGLIETDVEDVMKDVNGSMYVRMPFTVDDPSQFESLTLKMKYDDGYVAYLNGQEIARQNAPASPTWNSTATDERTSAEAVVWENVNVSEHLDKLVAGNNVLAIQVMNYTVDDGDLLVLPELVENVYLGLGEHYFATATPGEVNAEEYRLFVEDTKFSQDRGFYEDPFQVEITTDTEDAQIYYTTDGTEPGPTNGRLYSAPIPITTTTILRAAACKSNYGPSDVDTQTYLFLEDVIQQPSDPAGFPGSWNAEPADYEMDPVITGDPFYADTLKDDLLSLPTMSLVMDPADVFGSGGIYANPNTQGLERPASLEYFDPSTSEQFQVNAGARIYGGVGRQPRFKKHSFRILFKGDYGPTKLKFPLFEGAVDEFDTIILRSNFNDAWVWGGAPTQFVRDEFAGRLQNAMGDPGRHGNFVHLYVNGLYWGLYNPCERPDTSFSASYFGGDKVDWDGINSGNPVNTTGAPAGVDLREAWNTLMAMAPGLAENVEYQRVQGNNLDGTNNPDYEDYLDIDNYINFLLLNQWAGNNDWGSHNWYAGRMRGPDSTGWKSYSWDAEWIVHMRSGLNDNTVNDTTTSNWLLKPYNYLRNNAEFRLRYADHVHAHFFNGGVLTPQSTIPLYQSLADEIEPAVKAETARWGDVMHEPAYDLDDWTNERNYILDTYLPARSGIVLGQLKNANLYPDVVAPSFNVNGTYQHGGIIDLGDWLTIAAPAGTVYYTTDGTDPRELYGAVSPAANVYSGAIPLDESVHVKSRVRTAAGQWSALCEATFYVDLAPSIRITEIMYHPPEPTPAEVAAGYADKEGFEFIEIQNISPDQTLPLEGLRFSDGVSFVFPAVSVAPGEYVLVVKDEAAFNYRYPTFTGTIAGTYTGSLNNGGEEIVLDAPVGGPVHVFGFKDGWYGHTDGDGFSLTIRDPLGEAALWSLKEGWRASAGPLGTPGYGDTLVPPESVIISEVLAHSDGDAVDVIELHNVTDSPDWSGAAQAVDVSGWFLSDEKTDALGNDALTKYQIPALPPIQPGGYLVLYEHLHFGAAFALSELGDDVYLSSNFGSVAGGYREHVDFGASPPNVPIGLYTKSTGGTDFTFLSAMTFGSANADPYLENLVVNEVMYHPADPTADEQAAGFLNDDDFEFVEIYNRSTHASYALTNYRLGSGIGLTFGWYDADAAGNESWTLEAGATATWNATLPAGPGTYEVFARWNLLDAEGDDRNLDGRAVYTITHAAGSTNVIRDQKPEEDDEGPEYMDAGGWVSLGTYDFGGSGQVLLTRGTNDPDNWTIADQVKFVRPGFPDVVVDNPLLDSRYTSNGPAVIGPGQYVVVVNNYAAFDQRYDVAGNGIPVAGQYTGSLSNDGDKVKLFRQGNPEVNGFIPYYRIDYVNYNDAAPWPPEPDGQGSALNRIDTAAYGNDPINWAASTVRGTPGAANLSIDRTPPTVPQNLAGEVRIDPNTVALTWGASSDAETHVDHYLVYRDGELLGATPAASYDDLGASTAVAYSYQVAAVNRDGYASDLSAPTTMTIPGIVSYGVLDKTHVEITFSEPLDPATAEVLGNYAIVGGTLLDAALSPSGFAVTLTTAELVIGDPYSVTVSGVTTLSGVPMPDGQQIQFSYEPQGSGLILREYWTGIGGGSIADLTNHPNYPDNPSGWDYLTSFDGPVNWANSYGTRIRGYVHPPVTGDYTFWISGDDNSELYLSTDADPANAVRIAYVPGWSNWLEWDKHAEQKSQSIPLVAGRKYYVEVLHKEGSGGDNISVRWQLPDGSWEDPSRPGDPIPGIRLSPFPADVELPTANVVDVAPDPRTMPVESIDVVFSEQVSGFDISDLSLTRDGGANLLSAAQSISTDDNVTWTISGLTDVTVGAGTYLLTLHAGGSGIADVIGNLLQVDASETWVNEIPGPAADIVNVAPDPRRTPVGQIEIVFSEAVTGFEVGDLILSRDGGGNLLLGTEPLTSDDGATWILAGLEGLTATAGTYTLTLPAATSGIVNAAQILLEYDASDTWIVDTTPPTADIIDVIPDPRAASLDSIDIVFSEPIILLDIDDLNLSHNFGPNLLTGNETLTTSDNVTWTLSGLAPLTSVGGGATGFVAYNDHSTDYGGGTHANTTPYSALAGRTASGLLKDIATGADTGVTLTVTQAGVRFAGSQADPAPGTDAYGIFNGYVDLSGDGGSASIEIAGADHYTYTFTDLDTGGAATYDFHGTAVRGNSDYTNRWTLVTLEGAVSFTPDHSSGVGVVTAGLQPNQAAIWTGDNSTAAQGFVAGWTEIDPGPDGQFVVKSQQYKGPTPGVGTGDSSTGSKGYGIGGIRLVEVAFNGLPGRYTLGLSADGSQIVDYAGNPLTADASDTWLIEGGEPDTVVPTADILDVDPDPRDSAVDQIEIVFSEAVTGLDVADLTLTRDGGGNLLTGDEPLTTTDHVTWTLGGLSPLNATTGNYILQLTAAGSGIEDVSFNPLQTDTSDSWQTIIISPTPEIVGRYIFYNQSAFDGNDPAVNAADDGAVATDKTALRPGNPDSSAAFANYTSYHRGINGIMVDVADAPGAITADDFLFRVGNDSDPDHWAAAPAPQSVEVRPGAGAGGSDRVTIVWADHAIENQWLQVTVRADTLGLAGDDVFYFGHALAESGNNPADAQITTVDLLLARNNPRSFLNPATVDFAYDYNRDGRVNSTDVLLARNNQTNFFSALRLIDLSDPAPAAVAEAPLPSARRDLSPDQAAWLRQYDGADAIAEDLEKPDTSAEAVDLLLATYWP